MDYSIFVVCSKCEITGLGINPIQRSRQSSKSSSRGGRPSNELQLASLPFLPAFRGQANLPQAAGNQRAMGDISVLYVAIVRNDDPAKVIAAESHRRDLSKHNRKAIEQSIRSELNKSKGGTGRPAVVPIDPPAFLCSHELDLSTVGGRPWACVVCATATYSDGNALTCAKEIAQQLEDSMDAQQEIEAWARSSRGGAAGGLTKTFKWLAGTREKWDKEIKAAEVQRDLAAVKVRVSALSATPGTIRHTKARGASAALAARREF